MCDQVARSSLWPFFKWLPSHLDTIQLMSVMSFSQNFESQWLNVIGFYCCLVELQWQLWTSMPWQILKQGWDPAQGWWYEWSKIVVPTEATATRWTWTWYDVVTLYLEHLHVYGQWEGSLNLSSSNFPLDVLIPTFSCCEKNHWSFQTDSSAVEYVAVFCKNSDFLLWLRWNDHLWNLQEPWQRLHRWNRGTFQWPQWWRWKWAQLSCGSG